MKLMKKKKITDTALKPRNFGEQGTFGIHFFTKEKASASFDAATGVSRVGMH